MNIGMLLLVIIGGFAGLFSTLYICISLPFTIIWKIYRRVAKGIPIMKYNCYHHKNNPEYFSC